MDSLSNQAQSQNAQCTDATSELAVTSLPNQIIDALMRHELETASHLYQQSPTLGINQLYYAYRSSSGMDNTIQDYLINTWFTSHGFLLESVKGIIELPALAARLGLKDELEQLIEHLRNQSYESMYQGLPAIYDERTALHYAAQYGNTTLIATLTNTTLASDQETTELSPISRSPRAYIESLPQTAPVGVDKNANWPSYGAKIHALIHCGAQIAWV